MAWKITIRNRNKIKSSEQRGGEDTTSNWGQRKRAQDCGTLCKKGNHELPRELSEKQLYLVQMANQAEFSHQQQWPVRGRVKIFVNILISIYHLPCALHALSHVIFSPHNDAIFLSADICWFYKSGFQSHFFLLKIYWFSSRKKKKSSCAFDRAVLCLLWAGVWHDLGLTN